MSGREAGAFVGADGKIDATQVAEFITPDLGRGLDGDYYEYRDGVYRRDPEVITRRVADALGAKYSATLEGQVRAHLLNQTIEKVGVRDLPSGYLDYIVLSNGVYWWRSGELDPHSPGLGALTALPIEYDADAQPFNMTTWLEQVQPDADVRRHLWEVIGYVLMTGNPLQKVFLLHGEGGEGKGTFLRVLRRMLGEDNYSSLSLHTLVEDRFAAAALYGMIANISGDLSSRFLNEPEILKQITGGDAITAARKYGQHFTFVPYAVPIFAANEYFRTSDSSFGWRRRWEVIEFAQKVAELAGSFDEQSLFDELPGIFNAAMDGLRRLMERGRFDPPAAAIEATRQLHDAADPFMLWLDDDENVRRGEDETSPRADVYQRYSRWCRRNGYQPLASGPFGNRLKGIGIRSRESRAGGTYARYYLGISVMLTPED